MNKMHSTLWICTGKNDNKFKCYAICSLSRNNMQGMPYLQPFLLKVGTGLTAKVPLLHPPWLLIFFNSSNHDFDLRVHGCQSL